ncbi:TetR/AcrR family transcriptional regulator [Candidatus Poribacteria bacterium]|nr:TetR/AcrR family transcriptional regulator [Candidatus Poribacteria bacterium]
MARPVRKKADIERAALELFVERGIDGASIRMIAERAGVTEGALYRHHKGKDDLARALFFEHFERYAQLLRAADESAGTIEEKLRAMILGFYGAYDADPKAFLFVLLVQHALLDEVRADMANPVDVITEVIERAIRAGEVPAQDTAMTAQMMMGIVTQVAVGHRYGRLGGKLSRHTGAVTAACLRVLRCG